MTVRPTENAQREYPRLTPDQQLVFVGSLQRWTVEAVSLDARFAVLLSKGWYTIIDWKLGIRGRENLVFGRGCECRGDAEEMLQRIVTDETEISLRGWEFLRFSDYRPDPTVELGGMVAAAWSAYDTQPERRNTFYKTKPWAGLGPLSTEAWSVAANSGSGVSG